ncbi:MAG TPA: hypothetical protein P5572_21990, partial [Phycisphaerae bacterium]|nr:hypothetical protein [Phycisphaerae bacterium]
MSLLVGLLAVALGASAAPAGPERPAPGEVRAAVQEVLAAREFNRGEASTESWLTWVWAHFLGLLRAVRDWLHDLPPGVFYFIVTWLVLVLVAILVHLAYTIYKQFGGGGGVRGARRAAADCAVYGVAEL